MSTPPVLNPSLPDPRASADFRAEFYPTANGSPVPPIAPAESNDRIAREFLAAYYEINCRYAGLLEVRAEPLSEDGNYRERAILQEIETALRKRDALEDQYAPLGIIAEPVMKEGRTIDVRFTFGNVDLEGRRRNQPRFSSAVITIPMPPGVGGKVRKLPGKP